MLAALFLYLEMSLMKICSLSMLSDCLFFRGEETVKKHQRGAYILGGRLIIGSVILKYFYFLFIFIFCCAGTLSSCGKRRLLSQGAAVHGASHCRGFTLWSTGPRHMGF